MCLGVVNNVVCDPGVVDNVIYNTGLSILPAQADTTYLVEYWVVSGIP